MNAVETGHVLHVCYCSHHMSRVIRKPVVYICKNKDADQLRGNREADQRLCFRYTDSTIHLLSKFQASSHLVWSCSLVCVGPGRKPRRPVFSQRGSYMYVNLVEEAMASFVVVCCKIRWDLHVSALICHSPLEHH